jgi:cysteinyl-tRNA synthetase
VKYVQNVTDIDDKIIERANRLGTSTRELADRFTQSYLDDMAALNVEPPDERPRATETIPDMLKVIQGLIDKGFAYPSGGSVYFRVRKASDYGKLSRRNFDDMRQGDSDVNGEKEDPLDFVLWKASRPGEPSWESPWGPGRPGWHIECSVMSLKYFGDSFDIHGGGQDLVFPHHENEIAQSESYTGIKPVVRYWMHNGMVEIGAEKMSKSLGNLITIKDALGKYSADALRIFVLGSHYRSPLTYGEDILEAAERGAERLRYAAGSNGNGQKHGAGLDSAPYRQRFIQAMDDDFNTAQALAALFDLAREINRSGESGLAVEEARETLKELAGVLGMTLAEPEKPELEAQPFAGLRESLLSEIAQAAPELTVVEKSDPQDAAGIIERLVTLRAALRKNKQFLLADRVRGGLDALGIALEDTPQGTTWKVKR